jgi:hypothetical protein
MMSAATMQAPLRWRSAYLALLGGAFAFFNAVRLASYLPTLLTIQASGHSDQHSLLTWLGWSMANLSTALWLLESSRRISMVTAINFANAAMCAAVAAVTAWYRF